MLPWFTGHYELSNLMIEWSILNSFMKFQVIEGLGQHGMVGSADQSLINLHDGLRQVSFWVANYAFKTFSDILWQEFLMVREQYQTAIDKLEHLALASKEPLTNNSGDWPVSDCVGDATGDICLRLNQHWCDPVWHKEHYSILQYNALMQYTYLHHSCVRVSMC